MYSYLHRYHAGNIADVHKHMLLLALLNKLREKDTPFCVLDAFAGEGVYDLNTAQAQKNREYKQGILSLWGKQPASKLAQQYLEIVSAFNQNKPSLRMYPGSPAIIAHQLRAQDGAHFVEGHPACYPGLKKQFHRHRNIHTHQRDAYEALLALIPFKEKRGLVVLDPSYEVKQEYETIAQATLQMISKVSHYIYMIWYPILAQNYHTTLKIAFERHPNLKLFCHEVKPVFLQEGTGQIGLRGSGVLLINPPWQIEAAANEIETTMDAIN